MLYIACVPALDFLQSGSRQAEQAGAGGPLGRAQGRQNAPIFRGPLLKLSGLTTLFESRECPRRKRNRKKLIKTWDMNCTFRSLGYINAVTNPTGKNDPYML